MLSTRDSHAPLIILQEATALSDIEKVFVAMFGVVVSLKHLLNVAMSVHVVDSRKVSKRLEDHGRHCDTLTGFFHSLHGWRATFAAASR